MSEDPRRLALRQALRAARRAAGLTQMDVAQRLGQPQSYVSKYEAGRRRLDLVEVVSVCAVLGIGVQKLVDALEEDAGRQ